MREETLSPELIIQEVGNRLRRAFILTPREKAEPERAVEGIEQRLLEMPLGQEPREIEGQPPAGISQ